MPSFDIRYSLFDIRYSLLKFLFSIKLVAQWPAAPLTPETFKMNYSGV